MSFWRICGISSGKMHAQTNVLYRKTDVSLAVTALPPMIKDLIDNLIKPEAKPTRSRYFRRNTLSELPAAQSPRRAGASPLGAPWARTLLRRLA